MLPLASRLMTAGRPWRDLLLDNRNTQFRRFVKIEQHEQHDEVGKMWVDYWMIAMIAVISYINTQWFLEIGGYQLYLEG